MDNVSAHAGAVSGEHGGQAASNDEVVPPAPEPPAPEPSISLGPAPTTLSHFTARRALHGGTGSTLTSRGRGLRVRAGAGRAGVARFPPLGADALRLLPTAASLCAFSLAF
jgi:hypothetical protein